MSNNIPISLSRRHVLGDLYNRCDALEAHVPVYLEGLERELLGHADEYPGEFTDAISFFLGADDCKKLSSGHYKFAFDYQLSDPLGKDIGRVVVTSITLIAPQNYVKKSPVDGGRLR